MTDVQQAAPDNVPAPVIESPAEAQHAEQQAESPQQAIDIEGLAREMGWRPREDWKGDDSGWRDAGEFVRNTVDANRATKRELAEVKDTLKNLSKVNEKILQKELDKQRRQLEKEHARAVDENNPAEARRLASEIDALDRQPVQTDYRSKFKQDNPWFEADTEATAYAIAMAGVAAGEGKAPEDQLAYAADKVRKRFPELFDSKPQRTAPVLQTGQRGMPQPQKKYPPAVMAAANDAVRRGRAENVGEYLAMYDKEVG